MESDLMKLRKDIDMASATLLEKLDSSEYTPQDILAKLVSLGLLTGLNADLLDNFNASDFLLNSNYIQEENYADHWGYIHFKNHLIIQWGVVTVTCDTANTPAGAVVTFPIQFNKQPIVAVAAVTSSPGVWTKGVSTSIIYSNNFTMYATLNGAGSLSIGWIAIGKGS